MPKKGWQDAENVDLRANETRSDAEKEGKETSMEADVQREDDAEPRHQASKELV